MIMEQLVVVEQIDEDFAIIYECCCDVRIAKARDRCRIIIDL